MDYPKKILLKEVAPRDGWQKFPRILPTEWKIQQILQMIDYGAKEIEIGVFENNPLLIRQYQDIEELCREILPVAEASGVVLNAIVGNKENLIHAKECGIHKADFFISVSEKFGRGFGVTEEQAFRNLEEMTSVSGIEVRMALGAVFGSPFGDETPVERTIRYIEKGLELGIQNFGLADSAGRSDPLHTEEILQEVRKVLLPEQVTLHIHNTEGFGLANCCKAMEMGFFRFDTSLAGMGGCPVIPDAKGNIPTEDFVNLVNKMDIECDVNLDKCVDASLRMSEELGRNPISSLGEKELLERRNK